MLVSMKDILQHAHKHNYAVMAVNSINMEMARAVISAAEEEHSPIIVQMGPGQIGKHAHLTEIVPLVKELAERASIPVALNLDHGGKLEDMVTAIHNGFTVLDAGQVNDRGVDDIIAQVKQIVGDMPVYLTFDIDCLDPAFAPGTGTPVIGGLTSDRAIKLVRGLKDLNIVGMDVVEVAPAYDQSEITALAAATLALEMLYIQAAKKGE